jgi:hypothetical protein
MSILLNASTSTGLGITSDNSGTVEVQSNGTTKLTVSSTGVFGTVTAATAVASTSGNAIDFTGIPSWVKKITVMFDEVSLNGSANFLIQIGSGSVETTGYISTSNNFDQVGGSSGSSSTAGFITVAINNAAVTSGHYNLTLLGSNAWIGSGVTKASTNQVILGAGRKTASNTIDRVRITTTNGTDTFDAGSINIMYEG